jgi:hypothetical protein
MAWGAVRAKETKAPLKQIVAPLMPLVRFPLMSPTELSKVAEDTLPLDHLLMLFMNASLPMEQRTYPSDFPYSTSGRKGQLVFKFTSFWDQKGLFSYIGTKGFTAPWENPYLSGAVDIICFTDGTQSTSTSFYPLPNGESDNKKVLSYMLEQTNKSTTVCSSTQQAYFTIDLKEVSFKPNLITVRQNYSGSYIWGWTLSGSNDLTSWTDLCSNASGSGDVRECMVDIPADKSTEFFRYFKIHKPSSQVLLSGVELYGELKV